MPVSLQDSPERKHGRRSPPSREPLQGRISGCGSANAHTCSPGHQAGFDGWHSISRWPRVQRTSYLMGYNRGPGALPECDTSGISVHVARTSYCTAVRGRAFRIESGVRAIGDLFERSDAWTHAEAQERRPNRAKSGCERSTEMQRAQPGALLNPRCEAWAVPPQSSRRRGKMLHVLRRVYYTLLSTDVISQHCSRAQAKYLYSADDQWSILCLPYNATHLNPTLEPHLASA